VTTAIVVAAFDAGEPDAIDWSARGGWVFALAASVSGTTTPGDDL
jgi:hypothetical protein